ncbi:hypothetical protein [Achromobacter aloeverae]|uniref:Uncharacterized protein n=1 Tax=Achromobacter aloeverae TaxID=1750518 RepID=A0A4Q1HD72_9BURK|nr:hypothetical protein [Achromobacter aloeverae]RXN83734.1 hypothetical protein C7R54_26025 [Achromobacter aloeverae]
MRMMKAAAVLYVLALTACGSSRGFLGDTENVKTSNDVKAASSALIPKYKSHCGTDHRPFRDHDQWYDCVKTSAMIAESLILAERYSESVFYVKDAAAFWRGYKDNPIKKDNACDANILNTSYGIYGALVSLNYNQAATIINEKVGGTPQRDQLILAYLCALPDSSTYRSIIIEKIGGKDKYVVPEQFARFSSRSSMLDDLQRHFGTAARQEGERYFSEIDSLLKVHEDKAYLGSIGSDHNPNADVMMLYGNALKYARSKHFSEPYIKYLELRMQEAARYAGAT